MRITLFHNPSAGDKEHSRERLLEMLGQQGHTVAYQNVKAGDPSLAVANSDELAVCVGGDGTVGRLALSLMGRATPLAILPLGTANNIALSLGLEGTCEELIAQWPDARRPPFDVGVASGSWGNTAFLESFGVGLFPRVLEVSAEGRKNKIAQRVAHLEGIKRGCALFREVLRETKPCHLELHVEEEDLSGEYLGVQVMNIPLVGPNLPLAPEADPGDGLLDVVLLQEDQRAVLDDYLAQRIAGGDAMLKLSTRRARRVRMNLHSCRASVDDRPWPDLEEKSMRKVRAVELTVQRGVLRILRGAGT